MVDDGNEVAGQEDSRGASDHHDLGRLAWSSQSDAKADDQDCGDDDEAARKPIAPLLAGEPALRIQNARYL